MFGINRYETRQYVSTFETDKNNPTIFELGMIDPEVSSDLTDESSSFKISSKDPDDRATVQVLLNRRNLMLLRFGLKNVSNLIDPQTQKPIKFDTVAYALNGKSYNIASSEVIASIPMKVRQELVDEILRDSALSEDEIKN
jgi:hypothetical protein